MITFSQLEHQKTALLQGVEGWTEARLHFRPAPDAWSAVEMFDHLVRTEVEILAVTRRGMEKSHRIGLRDRLGERFLDRVFRSERRVKVPASAKLVLPASGTDLPSVLIRWEASRSELAILLSQTTPEQLQPGVFRHPVAGWMNLPQVLNFFSVHIIHHEFQLARLKDASVHLA